MDTPTRRVFTAQMLFNTVWQTAILADILFTVNPIGKDIESGIFHNDDHLWGCIAKSVLLPMLLGGGRDPALRRG